MFNFLEIYGILGFLCILPRFALNKAEEENKFEGRTHKFIVRSHKEEAKSLQSLDGISLRSYFEGHHSLRLTILGPDLNGKEIELFPHIGNEQQNKKNKIKETLCELEGKIRGQSDSSVIVNFCGQISGFIKSGENISEIFSAKTPDEPPLESTFLLLSSHQKQNPQCGVENKQTGDNQEIAHLHLIEGQSKTRKRRNVGTLSEREAFVKNWIRYIEVWFVVDRMTYEQFRGEEKVRRRCLDIVSYANVLFGPLMLKIVMAGLTIWKNRDAIPVTSDYKKLIEDFLEIRTQLLKEAKNHDHTLLLSGVDFHGNTVGYAYEGVMCKKNSVSVVQHLQSVSIAVVGGTVVHEIGHSLGCQHDPIACQTGSLANPHIMHHHGVNGDSWSDCSKIFLAKHIENFNCLRNKPSKMGAFPACGNGVLDHGEQCECVKGQDCAQCCDIVNCMLKPHAICGMGSCCNMTSCKPLPIATKCREAASECDLPEYCLGTSEFCPKNFYKQTASECHQGQGRCYKGVCKSEDSLCKFFMNPSSSAKKLPKNMAYPNNDLLGQCAKVSCHAHLIENDAVLWNEGTYTSLVISSTWFYLFRSGEDLFDDNDGILCGNNHSSMTCQSGKCLAAPSMVSQHCKSGCGGHGICNNEGHCHCDAGYAPPDCQKAGIGGSPVSGLPSFPKENDHSWNCLLAFFIIFPLIVFTCCCWTDISSRWYDSKMDEKINSKSRVAGGLLERCLCPCMGQLTKWIEILWTRSALSNNIEPSKTEFSHDPEDLRKTFCEVQVDIKPPEDQVKSWGVASETLVTDIITVTPQSTPDLQRKIRFKSSSEEKLDRPNYIHSFSKDSGYPSDTEDDISYRGSMGSLIAKFKNFGRQKSTQEESEETSIPTPIHHGTFPKNVNLRRMVVDPMSKRSLSKQNSNPLESSRPEYRRSFSCDSESELRLKKQLLLPPKLASKPLNLSDKNLAKENKPIRPLDEATMPFLPKKNVSNSLENTDVGRKDNSPKCMPPRPPQSSVKRPIMPPSQKKDSYRSKNDRSPPVKLPKNPSVHSQQNSRFNVADLAKRFET